MSMFDTTGGADDGARQAATLQKRERMRKTLQHEEPDRVPIRDFFWGAAQGGGFIFQSDHSVTSGVSGRTYDYTVKLVREHGAYPLDLGEFREPL